METDGLDPLPSLSRACLGFALSQIAVATLMLLLAASAANSKPNSIGLRGSLESKNFEPVVIGNRGLATWDSGEQPRDERSNDGKLCNAPKIVPTDLRCLTLTAELHRPSPLVEV